MHLCGAGKASCGLVKSFLDLIGSRVTGGLVITKYGHGLDLGPVRVLEAGHPIPDEASVEAGEAMLSFAASCSEKDLVIFVLTGGASALMEVPISGQNLETIRAATQEKMASGANIYELNAARKALSQIKGGKLGEAFSRSTVVCLVESDVANNDFSVIGSGPLFRPGIPHLMLAKPDDVKLATREAIQASGLTTEEPLHLEGEARVEAERLLRYADAAFDRSEGPACVYGFGETVVTVRGKGRGGRCQEFACAAAELIGGRDDLAVLAGSTDGTDGPTIYAGGLVDGGSVTRAVERGISVQEALKKNDSSAFLAACDGLIETGPTQCNLNDVYLVVRKANGTVTL